MTKISEVHYVNEVKNCGMCAQYWREIHLGRGVKIENVCTHPDVVTTYPPIPETGEIKQDAPQLDNFPIIPAWCPLPDKEVINV